MINKYRARSRRARRMKMTIVYQISNPGDAQLRVALVDRGMADLLVYRTSSRGMASRDSVWYITRDRQEAGVRVCFVSLGMAQLRIAFVSTYGEAGWQNPQLRHARML